MDNNWLHYYFYDFVKKLTLLVLTGNNKIHKVIENNLCI